MVIVLTGPPKAGKSRLRGDLYRALLAKGRGLRWFVQAFSPDCEGQWVNDSHALARGEEAEGLARAAKSALKRSGAFFSPEWVRKAQGQLEGLARWAEVLVVDLGGLPSQQNRDILAPVLGRADLAPVVLTRQGDDGGWSGFWASLGVSPVFEGGYDHDLAERLLSRVTA
jgi:hypothetical protein